MQRSDEADMNATAPAQTELEFLDYMIRHCCRMLMGSETLDAQLHWEQRLGVYLAQKKALGVVP